MKRIFVILLTFVLLLGICPMSALAETGGSGNVDGGGGDMGQGTSQNSWNPGMDGVRITVVDAESGQPVSSSFDLTNKTPSIKIHFGKVSKIQYANGASISPTTGNYDYYTPATPMPRIVSSGSQNASIEAIKKYFCSEYAVKLVAQQTGIAYEELIGGQYKLFLEPIAYFKHNGIMMAMTAHEAALYDNQAGGSLRKTMTSLTHKNLLKVRDLAKRSDLGNFSDVFEQTLPAHSAMFLRMEGETRLEPTLYEAEWAYLPMFNDLGKNPKGIIYAADQEASGKMKVGFLGGQPENYAEWSEVYSADGGRYQMTVHYSFGKGRQLEIDVNGIVTKIDSLGEDDKHNQVTIPVDLKAGYNHIRMGNSYNWAPDIDCFTLTKGM